MENKTYEHYGKLKLPSQDEVVALLNFIPCRTLKKASKDISCGLKGCYRCKRWFYERAILKPTMTDLLNHEYEELLLRG